MNTSYNFRINRWDKIFKAWCISFLSTLLVTIVLTGTAYGQQEITVTGQVTDDNNEPLPGATIVVEGTVQGTTSDLDGMYIIDVPEDGVLVISFVGYETLSIPVEGRERIDIQMNLRIGFLNEVVVIGYGTESRRLLTTSISSLGRQSLEGVPVASVSEAMQGKLSGVRVYRTAGGEPGADAAIRIRGGSSITGNNDPLVLVDGLRGSLNDLNPNDIESIQVLKDASSTAIYGSRASNGVVLITTKRGSESGSSITFETYSGIAEPWTEIDRIDARTFLEYARPALARSPNANALWGSGRGIGVGNGPESPWSPRYLEDGQNVPEGWESMPDPVDPSKTIIFQDNDFQDLALRRAYEQSYHISANGGAENIRYGAGIGYTDTEGVAIGTKWGRFSGRANIDFDLRDNLELRTDALLSTSNTNTHPDQRAMFARSIFLVPTARVYMDDGTLAPGLNASFTNPLWYNDVNQFETNRQNTQIGSSLIWDSNEIDGLRTTLNANYLTRNRTVESFEKANIYDRSRPADFNYDQLRRVQFEGFLNYSPSLNSDDHAVNFLAGANYEDTRDLDSNNSAFGGSTDKIQTLNAAPEKTNASTFKTQEVVIGFFGRASYDYKDKYIATFSMRRDASSRFSSGNRVGYFPGGSLGWIISEETFFSSSFIDLLKIRTSYGQTGNVVSGLYDAFGEYSLGRNYFNQAGSFSTTMPNRALQWEKTTQWDVGLDMSLFNEQISLIADYYIKQTDDLLFSTPLPRETGYSSIERNVGSVKFRGFDVELNANLIEGTDFSWNVGFNYSYNKNEVVSLPDNGVPQNRIGGFYDPETGIGVGGIAEGEPLGQIYGFKSDFIIDTQEQADNANWDSFATGYDWKTGETTQGKKFPGDIEWVDRDGDGQITQRDQFVLGYSRPHTFGGITNNFAYKNFQLDVFMDYAVGHSILDLTFRRQRGNVIGGAMVPTSDIKCSWKEEGDAASGNACMPRFDWHEATQQRNIHRGGFGTDRSTYRADFLSLREVRLAYTLPESALNIVGLSRLTIYLRGQNLYYFTDYPGFVPEFEGNHNYSDGQFPIPRKFLLGINFSL